MLNHYKKKHKTPNRPLECFNWSEQWKHVRFRQQNVPLNTRHSNYWLAVWLHYWKSSCVATLMHFPETEREKRRCRWWQQLWKWLQISRGLWILSLLDCINYPACTISTTLTVLGKNVYWRQKGHQGCHLSRAQQRWPGSSFLTVKHIILQETTVNQRNTAETTANPCER